MRFVPPSRWPASFLVAAPVGFLLGVLPLQEFVAGRGGSAGGVNLVLLNVVLPLCSAGLAVFYPRARVAMPAAILLVVSCWLGRMLLHEWHFWIWTFPSLLSRTHPLFIAGAIGCALVAGVCAQVTKIWRRVGLPDEHLRCRRCGYLLAGSPPPRCPECGKLRASMDP